MPHFSKQGNHFFVSYITGPSHVRLGLLFGENGKELKLTKQPPISECNHGELNEDKIKEAVFAGIALANEKFNANFQPLEIIYVENDSPRYDLFAICAKRICERIAQGGEFES